jgi:glutamyl-tRNA synthetase
MLAHEIKEEQAVLRFKSDLTNKDPSTRDWWLAKVVDTVNHPNPLVRDKHVWPSYNLASAVDDKEMNINFIARGQEHVQNGEKQKMLYDLFGWEYPHCVYFGKIDKLGNMILSKSKMKLLMEKEGIVGQYDDPRMTTIMAFRRRGFRPETIRKIILDMGVNTKTAKITIENLGSTNKEFLGEVKELPFFEEGIETEIIGMVEGDGESYGEKVKFSGGIEKLIVDKKEALKYKNKLGTIVRLKKAFNAKVIEATEFSMKLQFISYAKTEHPVISWVKGIVDAEIIMDDASKRVGITAKSALEEKGIKHFEGLGYANIEEIKGNYVRAVFAHK